MHNGKIQKYYLLSMFFKVHSANGLASYYLHLNSFAMSTIELPNIFEHTDVNCNPRFVLKANWVYSDVAWAGCLNIIQENSKQWLDERIISHHIHIKLSIKTENFTDLLSKNVCFYSYSVFKI